MSLMIKGLSTKGQAFLGFYKKGIATGIPANAIITALRNAGAKTYRRTDMLRDIRLVKGANLKFESMKYVRKDLIVSDKHYLTTAKEMTTRYKTVVRIVGSNKITGDSVVRHITVSHDTNLRREEIEQASLLALEKAQSPTEVEAIMPVEGYKYP